MELLANELSIHGQFHDISSFRHAFGRLMAMRNVARRFGRDVQCHRALVAVEVLLGVRMQQALGRLAESERRAAMGWLARGGPFWDDVRRHDVDDWLDCQGEIVTDTAVGEAAYRMLHGVECGLISFTPSDWDFSPIEVFWRREAEDLTTEARVSRTGGMLQRLKRSCKTQHLLSGRGLICSPSRRSGSTT